MPDEPSYQAFSRITVPVIQSNPLYLYELMVRDIFLFVLFDNINVQKIRKDGSGSQPRAQNSRIWALSESCRSGARARGQVEIAGSLSRWRVGTCVPQRSARAGRLKAARRSSGKGRPASRALLDVYGNWRRVPKRPAASEHKRSYYFLLRQPVLQRKPRRARRRFDSSDSIDARVVESITHLRPQRTRSSGRQWKSCGKGMSIAHLSNAKLRARSSVLSEACAALNKLCLSSSLWSNSPKKKLLFLFLSLSAVLSAHLSESTQNSSRRRRDPEHPTRGTAALEGESRFGAALREWIAVSVGADLFVFSVPQIAAVAIRSESPFPDLPTVLVRPTYGLPRRLVCVYLLDEGRLFLLASFPAGGETQEFATNIDQTLLISECQGREKFIPYRLEHPYLFGRHHLSSPNNAVVGRLWPLNLQDSTRRVKSINHLWCRQRKGKKGGQL